MLKSPGEEMVASAFRDPHSPQPVHGVRGVFPPRLSYERQALNSAVWSLVPSAGQMRALQAYRVCNGSKEANCLLQRHLTALSQGDTNDMSQPSAGYPGLFAQQWSWGELETSENLFS